jgi:hypothetical protein
MLKANNEHLLLDKNTLQSNFQRLESTIVSLEAELSSVNTKIVSMNCDIIGHLDHISEQDNQIADLNI